MTFHASQRGEWMRFWSKPLCFQVSQLVGIAQVPQWQLKQFLNEQVAAVKVYNGPHEPAW